MDLPEPLKSPPPRDLRALEPALVHTRRRYYRWPLAAITLTGISTGVIALSLLFSSAASWLESLGQPIYALAVVALFLVLPAWLVAWTRVRALNRLLREGAVWPATVVASQAPPGWAPSLTVAFSTDASRFQVTVRLPTASAAPTGDLFVVFAPARSSLAAVVTADDGVLVGRALPHAA